VFVREETEEGPSKIQTLEDISCIVRTLLKELTFKLFKELKIKSIIISKSFLTNDCLHGLSIFTNGIECIKLVRHFWVINSSETFSDSRLHETRERGQHIDWWIDLSVVEISINENLTFSNISCKIRNWMSNVIIRHSQDG